MYKSLAHMKWECKYHLVWKPKCRKKRLFGKLGRALGPVLKEFAGYNESEVLKGCLCPDHVHVLIVIPPKDVIRAYIRQQDQLELFE